MSGRSLRVTIVFLLIGLGICRESFGWAHQGHILITRLAALRIIDDPNAPAGLRDFLKSQMQYTMEDCHQLATVETVGILPDVTKYDRGLDRWCTMPDQIKMLTAGKRKIDPYGQTETWMHFLDLEAFAPEFIYKDNLSEKPDIKAIPHNLTDPRWKTAGFVPWRVDEMYHRVITDLGSGPVPAQPELALQDMGFLCHYIQDSTQPHHATVDYNSITYLAGRVPGIPAMSEPGSTAMARMRLPKRVDPHGDLEFEIFVNDVAPRDAYRKQYWETLLKDINKLSADAATQPAAAAGAFDPFEWDIRVLLDSYDALPLVGHAAQAAYATGEFDPKEFFPFEGTAWGQKMSIIDLIALQNAKAVLHTEHAIRLAWDAAHSSAGK